MSTSNATTPTRIPFFKAGDLTASDGRQVSFSVADLQAIAQSYEPELSPAPLVVGHPQMDDPAFGWAQSLRVEGDTLVADVDRVEAQFAQMVNDGRFPNRSASIYLPTTPGNPKPGQFYLKHIGFLGAAAPAIPGLSPVKFAADDKALSFSFDPADFRPINTPEHSSMDTKPDDKKVDTAVDFAQQQADLAKRDQELTAREKKFKAEQVAVERSSAVNFAKSLVDTGKLLPAESDAVVELLMALPSNEAPISFSQAGSTVSKPARDMMREFLTGLPQRIDYKQKSEGKVNGAAVSFAAPQGAQIDASRADLYAKTKEIQASHKGMSFTEAARMAGA